MLQCNVRMLRLLTVTLKPDVAHHCTVSHGHLASSFLCMTSDTAYTTMSFLAVIPHAVGVTATNVPSSQRNQSAEEVTTEGPTMILGTAQDLLE